MPGTDKCHPRETAYCGRITHLTKDELNPMQTSTCKTTPTAPYEPQQRAGQALPGPCATKLKTSAAKEQHYRLADGTTRRRVKRKPENTHHPNSPPGLPEQNARAPRTAYRGAKADLNKPAATLPFFTEGSRLKQNQAL